MVSSPRLFPERQPSSPRQYGQLRPGGASPASPPTTPPALQLPPSIKKAHKESKKSTSRITDTTLDPVRLVFEDDPSTPDDAIDVNNANNAIDAIDAIIRDTMLGIRVSPERLRRVWGIQMVGAYDIKEEEY